jgi:hypothetical protein
VAAPPPRGENPDRGSSAGFSKAGQVTAAPLDRRAGFKLGQKLAEMPPPKEQGFAIELNRHGFKVAKMRWVLFE